jgi:hypothetical protein
VIPVVTILQSIFFRIAPVCNDLFFLLRLVYCYFELDNFELLVGLYSAELPMNNRMFELTKPGAAIRLAIYPKPLKL